MRFGIDYLNLFWDFRNEFAEWKLIKQTELLSNF